MLIKSNENEYDTIIILEMAQIIYKGGKSDIFEAVHIADEGVYTGRIINQNLFINAGFIPKENIKKIIGGVKRNIHIRKSKY